MVKNKQIGFATTFSPFLEARVHGAMKTESLENTKERGNISTNTEMNEGKGKKKSWGQNKGRN